MAMAFFATEFFATAFFATALFATGVSWMRQVGHTLGLAHNFMGSTACPGSNSDRAAGQAGSCVETVMDYPGPMVGLDPAGRCHPLLRCLRRCPVACLHGLRGLLAPTVCLTLFVHRHCA